jgi:hypothetical protein
VKRKKYRPFHAKGKFSLLNCFEQLGRSNAGLKLDLGIEVDAFCFDLK